MTERLPETGPRRPALNRIVIIDALEEMGIPVVMAEWLSYTDEEVMAELTTVAHWLNIGMEDMLEACKIGVIETNERGAIHEV